MERLISDFDEGFIKIYTYVDILDVFIIVLNPFFICGIVIHEFQKPLVNDLNI